MANASVISNQRILGGTPVVAGTRVPAENVLAELRAGKAPFEIFRHYPSLPPDAIDAVLEWDRQGRKNVKEPERV
jgi:uncharacterized protein (DUF433 family)